MNAPTAEDVALARGLIALITAHAHGEFGPCAPSDCETCQSIVLQHDARVRGEEREAFAKTLDDRAETWSRTALSVAVDLRQPSISPAELCGNLANECRNLAAAIRARGAKPSS
jgi:hypothetical protein